jgi:hypothetical protein
MMSVKRMNPQRSFWDSHSNVTISLERHESKGSSGLNVTKYKIGENIQASLDVGDGLNNTSGKGKSEKCQKQGRRPTR